VLLSREISIPSRKVLKSPSLHRFASTRCLLPGLTGSKAILVRELVKGRTHSCSATPKASLVSDP
jgi:hypothetical protein